MNPAILDTDTLSEILKRRDRQVVQNARVYLSQYRRFEFSAITRYEVRRGYLSRKAIVRLQRFEVLCQNSLIYPIADGVLDRAAELWADGRNRGLPHNDADLIVASTALVYGRTLVTGNIPHFRWIPGLLLEDWRNPLPAP
jgi:tRNA(fMet)-specific endonuclease VapC